MPESAEGAFRWAYTGRRIGVFLSLEYLPLTRRVLNTERISILRWRRLLLRRQICLHLSSFSAVFFCVDYDITVGVYENDAKIDLRLGCIYT